MSPSSPRTSVKKSTLRRRGLGARLGALGGEPRGDRREDVALDRLAALGAEPQRVEDRGEPRAFGVASEHVAIAALAARQFDHRARHRRLAEIERRAVAARAAAQHDEAGLDGLQIARAVAGQCSSIGPASSSTRARAADSHRASAGGDVVGVGHRSRVAGRRGAL